MDIQNVRNLIAGGDIKEAISALDEDMHELSKQLQSELLSLQSRHSDLRAKEIRGYSILKEENKIRDALIKFLDKIEEGGKKKILAQELTKYHPASPNEGVARQVYENFKIDGVLETFWQVDNEIKNTLAKGGYDDLQFAEKIEEVHNKLLFLKREIKAIEDRRSGPFYSHNKILKHWRHLCSEMLISEVDGEVGNLPEFEKMLISAKNKEILIFIGLLTLGFIVWLIEKNK